MITSALPHLQRLDRNREGVPGGHRAAFGGGLTPPLGWGARTPSPWLRATAGVAGIMLIVRARVGRNGPWARLRAGTSTPSLPAREAWGPVE